MNKFKIISLTASLVLAMVFTFSCSDDGGGEEKYSYCIKDEFCHEGPYTLDACSSFGGMPSNNCPNSSGGESSSSVDVQGGVSSSSILGGQGSSSSSSVPPSSSSSAPSSSSVAPSSSSAPPSSSSIAPSSSSLAPSSSSSVGFSGTYGSLFYEGQTYKTVRIGEQVWFAENLNYAPSSGTYISCDRYDCAKYGRLYDWSTAMGLSSCNTSDCSSQIQSPHRGICPSGWHIPSSEDWGKLSRYVDGTSGTNAGYQSTTAGKYLKSKSGWPPYSGIENLDTHGFSALPGGSFGHVGSDGYWWSAYENYSFNAYYRLMSYGNDNAYWYYDYKSNLYSVRCLQD